MRKEALVAAVIIALAVIAGVLFLVRGTSPVSEGPVAVASFQTDKNLYHSKEMMQLQVSISSGSPVQNATVHIWGIIDRHGDTHLIRDIPVELKPGMTTITTEYQLPSCSKCSGIDPGNYTLNLKVVRDGNQLLAVGSRTVHLEQ